MILVDGAKYFFARVKAEEKAWYLRDLNGSFLNKFFDVLLFVELWISLNSFSGLWLNAISAQKLPLWFCTLLYSEPRLSSSRRKWHGAVNFLVCLWLLLHNKCITVQILLPQQGFFCISLLAKLQTSVNTGWYVLPVSELISSSSWCGDSLWCELRPKSSRQFWVEPPTTSPTSANA